MSSSGDDDATVDSADIADLDVHALVARNPLKQLQKRADLYFKKIASNSASSLITYPETTEEQLQRITSCQDFLKQLRRAKCYCPNKKKFMLCYCVFVSLATDEAIDACVTFMGVLGNSPKNLRKTQLLGIMNAAKQFREIDCRFNAYLKRSRRRILQPIKAQQYFAIPGISPVCRTSFMNICALTNKVWTGLMASVDANTIVPLPHRGIGNKRRTEYSAFGECLEDLKTFFEDVIDDYGEPWATRFVREKVSLRECNEDDHCLPSSFTKRKLYELFCYHRGYNLKSSKATKIADYPLRDDFDDILWTEDSQPLPVCSESSFRRFWKKEFPNLKIRPPSEDICGECLVYRNSFKYTSKRKNDLQELSDIESECQSVGSSSSSQSNTTNNITFDEVHDFIKDSEQILKDAGEHVEKARQMRFFAANCMNEAQQQASNTPQSEKKYVIVMDYSQNLDLPHLGSSQPGDSYYFSPKNVYIFGIVNVSQKPNKLTAYVYQEEDGNKGGDNVASLLMCYLTNNIIRRNEIGGCLTIIADNCAGQNKNNSVLRMALWLVEMKHFNKVQIVFYVKGHTKNACDRMFNLLKKKFHKQDVYCFQQLCEILQDNTDVTVVPTNFEFFYSWSNCLNVFYKKFNAGTIMKNHLFFVTRDEPTVMKTMVCAGNYEIQRQELIKNSKGRSEVSRSEEMQNYVLTKLNPPGLKPIKQVELFTKWRQFVIEEYKDVTCPRPSDEIMNKIRLERSEKQRNFAKKSQKNRNETNNADGNDVLHNMEEI